MTVESMEARPNRKHAQAVIGIGVVGIAALLVGGSVRSYHDGKNSRDAEVAALQDETQAFGWLLSQGFTNVDAVYATERETIVTLKEGSCVIAFDFTTPEQANHQLELEQADAAGKVFSTITVTSPEAAALTMSDICPPK